MITANDDANSGNTDDKDILLFLALMIIKNVSAANADANTGERQTTFT